MLLIQHSAQRLLSEGRDGPAGAEVDAAIKISDRMLQLILAAMRTTKDLESQCRATQDDFLVCAVSELGMVLAAASLVHAYFHADLTELNDVAGLDCEGCRQSLTEGLAEMLQRYYEEQN
jgi:hypothetical protein